MRRVVILGRGGAGKSVLARRLGAATGLPVIDRAGVRDAWLTPHSLRHTHATRMFEAGMRELTLMTRLGHATPDSMKVYTRFSDPEVLKDYRHATPAMASRSWLPGDLAVAIRALQPHPVKCAEWAGVASVPGSGRRGGMHGKRAEQDGDVCGRVAWFVSPGDGVAVGAGRCAGPGACRPGMAAAARPVRSAVPRPGPSRGPRGCLHPQPVRRGPAGCWRLRAVRDSWRGA